MHRTRNPRGRQCWGSALATSPFLLRQQEQSDQCFKTLLTTEPSLKEISMCMCTCAQVCVRAQMLGSEHRHKGPVKKQPPGEVLNFVSFVSQASWDPSFYGSTGTTSVYNSPLYPLSHDPSSQSPIFLRKKKFCHVVLLHNKTPCNINYRQL